MTGSNQSLDGMASCLTYTSKQNEVVHVDKNMIQTGLDHTSPDLSSGSSTPYTISTASGSEYLEECEVAYLDSRRLSMDDPLKKNILAVGEPMIRDEDVDVDSIQVATDTTHEVVDHGAPEMQVQKDELDITMEQQKSSTDELPFDEALREVVANLNHGRNVIEPTPEMRQKVRLATLGKDYVTDANETFPITSAAGTQEPIAQDDEYLWRNEFLIIKESPLGGYGAFAARNLDYGEIILVEKPLVRTVQLGLVEAVDDLDLEEQILYVNLAKFPPVEDCGLSLVERVRRANAFQVPGGIAIFSVASRFNHACDGVRNVMYSFEKMEGRRDREVIVFQVIDPDGVAKGRELTVKYGNYPAILMRNFGFRCQCGGCADPVSDREAKQIRESWGWERSWDY